jgi:ubiquinone/menaquinone biosynthesis C-methylase UbiE
MPFRDSYFDLVISFGNTYTLNLSDAVLHLKELNRVTKKHSLISLATYYTEKDFWLMRKWSLLGNLILKEEEWKEVLDFANYSGDFFYVSAKTLGLSDE